MGFSSLVSFILVLIMWVWPIDGAVVRPFDPPPQPWLPGHRGADLAGAVGDEVKAAGAGVVAFAGLVVDRPLVSIDHAGGLRTTYEPVTPVVRAGESVTAGDIIGHLLPGHAGCPRACLHWGLRHGDDYLDPLALVVPVRVRLLPTGAGHHPRKPASPARHRARRQAGRRAAICRRRVSQVRSPTGRSGGSTRSLETIVCRRRASPVGGVVAPRAARAWCRGVVCRRRVGGVARRSGVRVWCRSLSHRRVRRVVGRSCARVWCRNVCRRRVSPVGRSGAALSCRGEVCRRRASRVRGVVGRSGGHLPCPGAACFRRRPSAHPPAGRPRRARRPGDVGHRRRICLPWKDFRSIPRSARRGVTPPEAAAKASGPPRPPRPPAPPGQPPAEPAPEPRRPPRVDLCWRDVPLGWGFAIRGHRFRHRYGVLLGTLRALRRRIAGLSTLAWQAMVLAGARRRRRPVG